MTTPAHATTKRARTRTPRIPRPASELEALLLLHLSLAGVPTPEQQVRFHPTRRWRFDLAWSAARVAVEADGGTWSGGRHVSGTGFEADCEKINAAQIAGWVVLRFTRRMIESGQAVQVIALALSDYPTRKGAA